MWRVRSYGNVGDVNKISENAEFVCRILRYVSLFKSKNGFIVYFKEGNFLYCFVCCLPAGKGSVPDMRKYLHT